MDEKGLLELWNTKRSQVINAQIAPTLMLIGVFVLAAYGKFETATDAAKYLTIGVAAATGILAIISQYATIREAEILLVDLKRLEKPSELSKKIEAQLRAAAAKENLTLTAETRICRFDPPFKPGFMQYNEIVIPIVQ
jgi:hypothetical protein